MLFVTVDMDKLLNAFPKGDNSCSTGGFTTYGFNISYPLPAEKKSRLKLFSLLPTTMCLSFFHWIFIECVSYPIALHFIMYLAGIVLSIQISVPI